MEFPQREELPRACPQSYCGRYLARGENERRVEMSDIFRPYERLVPIRILGRPFEVPEKNSLLRAFQYISPETVPYGRFCWNQECQYCKVTCKLPDDPEARPMLACKFLVVPGMEVTDLSAELKWCLSRKLGGGDIPQPPAVEGPPTAAELSQS